MIKINITLGHEFQVQLNEIRAIHKQRIQLIGMVQEDCRNEDKKDRASLMKMKFN